MLPFPNLVFLLLTTISCIQTPSSHALTLELIPPTSPESPFYNARSHRLSSNNTSITNYGAQDQLAGPPVEIKQLGLHAVKLGMGTFPHENPPYKSYYLAMDTGSDLIWLQCEGCKKHKKCFNQRDPPFPSTASQTFRPMQCDRDPKLCGSRQCDGKFCVYDVSYEDGSHSKGVIAHEKFTLNGDFRQTVDIRFGCGLDQKDVKFAKEYPPNQLAGILGLGWGPDALHIQLDSETDSKFSYCLQSEHTPPHATYLKFGSDVQVTPDFQKTKLTKYHTLYTVSLESVGIIGKKLSIPSNNNNNQKPPSMILDSGASCSYLIQPLYEDVERWLVGYFAKDQTLVRKDRNNQFCYDRVRGVPPGHEYDGLPTISFDFEGGAEFVMKPDGVFLADVDVHRKQFFCLMIYPDEKDNVLGSYQQANHRMVFDLKNQLLKFKAENC